MGREVLDLVSLCLWTVHLSVSVFFFLVHGTGWLEWVEVGYFSSPTWKLDPARVGYFIFLSQLSSVIPQQVRFWLTSFPWSQTLLRRIECSQVFFFKFLFYYYYFYFTILYWFCHTSTWIHHGCTCVPNPEPLSHFPPHTISLGHPSAPAPSILYPASNLDRWFISYMILYMFQCHSPKSSHPLPLPQSQKVCSVHLHLFCCLTYRVIITIFLNSIYMC